MASILIFILTCFVDGTIEPPERDQLVVTISSACGGLLLIIMLVIVILVLRRARSGSHTIPRVPNGKWLGICRLE